MSPETTVCSIGNNNAVLATSIKQRDPIRTEAPAPPRMFQATGRSRLHGNLQATGLVPGARSNGCTRSRMVIATAAATVVTHPRDANEFARAPLHILVPKRERVPSACVRKPRIIQQEGKSQIHERRNQHAGTEEAWQQETPA